LLTKRLQASRPCLLCLRDFVRVARDFVLRMADDD
jgi:hypothetical protein